MGATLPGSAQQPSASKPNKSHSHWYKPPERSGSRCAMKGKNNGKDPGIDAIQMLKTHMETATTALTEGNLRNCSNWRGISHLSSVHPKQGFQSPSEQNGISYWKQSEGRAQDSEKGERLLAIDWIMREITEWKSRGIQWTLFSQLEDLDFNWWPYYTFIQPHLVTGENQQV